MKLHAIKPTTFDKDLDYFPLYEGLKPSAMGLKKLKTFAQDSSERNKTFQFGESFSELRKSKEICRTERLGKYYQKTNEVFPEIIQYIVESLVEENSQHFKLETTSDITTLVCLHTDEELVFNDKWELVDQKTNLSVPFVDAFDALAMQVPEDLVIHKIPSGQINPFKSEEDKRDYAAYIHLCHCNGWNAEWALNKTFNEIHEFVPRINEIVPNATRMMLSFLNQEWRFERVAAISFKTSHFINRHEEEMKLWAKPFLLKDPCMNLRVERQTVRGFPKSEAFLFTIRTYLYNLDVSQSEVEEDIKTKRREKILETFNNPDPKSYAHNVIVKHQKKVLKWLNKGQK